MKEKTNIKKLDETDPERVNRGSSWFNDARYIRVFNLNWSFASNYNQYLGFRLVLQTRIKK
jgi:formylglycine-generating enzyme required for sulfatase activity